MLHFWIWTDIILSTISCYGTLYFWARYRYIISEKDREIQLLLLKLEEIRACYYQVTKQKYLGVKKNVKSVAN